MAAADVEVCVELAGRPRLVGHAWRQRARGRETVSFGYDAAWLSDPDSFALEPALPLTRGTFAPPAGLPLHASLGDSAPDTWGRRLMQRAERHRAERAGARARTLTEVDYLLGVSDVARMGAWRLRWAGSPIFEAPLDGGVPPMVKLGQLLEVSERVLRDEDTAEDLQLIFAPGSSLGGARPKASVLDGEGHLCIAKFPRETDAYSHERWEAIAVRLAARAGIVTPPHRLIEVGGRPVFVSRRFDRHGAQRIHFLSAMALLGARDGSRASYPELVDALAQHGAQGRLDARELYRRVAFSVLISNVDDHLRNHGLVRSSSRGWRLSPAYDLNPVPAEDRARILSTNISLEDGTCSVELLEESAPYFGLGLAQARTILKEVGTATSAWRRVATRLGALKSEVARMASAFEHADASYARAL